MDCQFCGEVCRLSFSDLGQVVQVQATCAACGSGSGSTLTKEAAEELRVEQELRNQESE